MPHEPAMETFRGVVYPWFCDVMGHMNTQFYCTLFDGATLHFLNTIAKRAELEESNLGWADVRQLIEYRHESLVGELLVVSTKLLKIGRSSLTFRHEMYDTDWTVLHATSEHVVTMFDLKERKSTALVAVARQRAERLLGNETNTH
jgi:acyl-CoA thioester hydrolase